jgi:hypothetical protein
LVLEFESDEFESECEFEFEKIPFEFLFPLRFELRLDGIKK